MAVISYTAKRNLAPGHIAGTEYDIEIGLAKFDRSVKAEGAQHRSLSGVTETYVHRLDRTVDVLSDKMNEWDESTEESPSVLDCMREFVESVLGGEEFYIDFAGTLAVPVAPVLYELDSQNIREQREGQQYISIPFTVRKVA